MLHETDIMAEENSNSQPLIIYGRELEMLVMTCYTEVSEKM